MFKQVVLIITIRSYEANHSRNIYSRLQVQNHHVQKASFIMKFQNGSLALNLIKSSHKVYELQDETSQQMATDDLAVKLP
jgi:hypothetical protein